MPTDDGATTALSRSCLAPWRQGFQIGLGLDALTGYTTASAFEPFVRNSVPGASQKSATTHLCYDRETSLRALAASRWTSQETYNLAPLVGPMGAMHRPVVYSTRYLTVIFREEVLTSHDLSNTYTLTPDATKLLAENAAEFRQRFGDYFIAGYQLGSSIEIAFSMVFESATARSSVISQLESSASTACGETISTQLLQQILDTKGTATHLSTNISLIGVREFALADGSELAPVDPIMRALESFRQHLEPLPVAVHLLHYSTIVPGPLLSNMVPVHPDVFQELRWLRNCLRSHLAVPDVRPWDVAEGPLRERIHTLHASCTTQQRYLVSDDSLRQRLLQEAEGVGKELERLNAAFDVWQRFGTTQQPQRIISTRPPVVLALGVVDQSDPLLEIETCGGVLTAAKHFSLWPLSPSRCTVTSDQLSRLDPRDARPQRIVGCTIESRHGRGLCYIPSDRFLLSPLQHDLPIIVTSGRIRRDVWDIKLFVSRNRYVDDLALDRV